MTQAGSNCCKLPFRAPEEDEEETLLLIIQIIRIAWAAAVAACFYQNWWHFHIFTTAQKLFFASLLTHFGESLLQNTHHGLTAGQWHVSSVATRTNRKPQAAQLKKKIWLCMWWTEGSFSQPPCFANSFYGFFGRWVCKTNTADFFFFWKRSIWRARLERPQTARPSVGSHSVVENAITFVTDNDIEKIYLTLGATLTFLVILLLYLDATENHPFVIKILAGLADLLSPL